MSMHQWYDTMYGIQLPYVKIDGDKVLIFIENHKERFNYDDLPKTAKEAVEYVYNFEDFNGTCGLAPFISSVADNKYICADSDEYGDSYIGMFADTLFPWDTLSDDWTSVKREDIESEIRSLIEELGIECPEFYVHAIWKFG